MCSAISAVSAVSAISATRCSSCATTVGMTSIWTREELLEQIALYKNALKACATGQSYTIGSRSLTRQDIAELRYHLNWLQDELAALDGQRGPVFVQGIVPRRGWWR